jgi:hypothetical protein
MKILISQSDSISDAKEMLAHYLKDPKVARIVQEATVKLSAAFKKHSITDGNWMADDRGRKRNAIETVMRGFGAKLLGAGVANQRNEQGNKPLEVVQQAIEQRALSLLKDSK